VTAYERITAALRDLGHVTERNGAARAKCPAHNGDSITSLSIRPIEGSVLLHCFAGCQTVDVLAALNLVMADLFDDRRGARYGYPDDREVHRTPEKKFYQRGNTKGRSLFRADRVGDAVTVYFVEGEKDVLAIESAGGAAVCSAMGAGNADKFDMSPLAGKNVIIVADKDEPGRKHARQVAALLGGVAASVRIVEAAEGKDAADHIAAGEALGDFVDTKPVDTKPAGLKITTLADVKPERVEWLWPGRLPRGKLVVFDGDPELGKSTIALTIASTVSNGGDWPDGQPCPYPGDVLILSAEDGLADTVRPRVDAAGGDPARVHAIEAVVTVNGDGEQVERSVTLADVEPLRQAVKRFNARLVIVDVLMAYLPTDRNSHRDQDIRAVFTPLARIAEETGTTILVLRHLNKSSGGNPLYRGGGSIGIVGAARVGLLVAKCPADGEDEDEPGGRCALAVQKNNLSAKPATLTYRITGHPNGAGRVRWIGTTDKSVHELLADADSGHDDDDRNEVDGWLREYLECEGSANAADAIRDGRKAGFSEDQVRKARKRVGAKTARQGFGAGSSVRWSIDAIDAHRCNPTGVTPMAPMGDSAPMDAEPEPAGDPLLFGPQQTKTPTEEVRRCDCGNKLLTPDAINSGKCKSCRDRQKGTAA